MNRDQKAAVIEEVAAQISGSEAVYAVDYRGISVPQAAELRTKLRDADASFRVVKNTLGERAADQAGAAGLKELLQGPTAMTFVRGDAAAAAKALRDFHRATQLLENYQAIVEELIKAKPSAAKGKYLRTIVMASTMGPGIKVDPSRTRDLIEAEAVPA